jgi:hypothetical protein
MIRIEREILESLCNGDVLLSYIRAAVADQGQGVKVNGALWPHLAPPAKIGGVARALVKMGLLVPAGGGVYRVLTERDRSEQKGRDLQATGERGCCETEATATQVRLYNSFEASGSEAAMEQFDNNNAANGEHVCPEEGQAALGNLMDGPQRQAPTMGMGFRRPPVHPASESTPELEIRARELARKSWSAMPDAVKARVGHDFEEFWKTSAGRFRRDAAF